ncbi:hypothetical protein TRVA0_012S02190 [Trichomonascus vanleenenianus]|uniref:uncharacterized protein n=1 Tax=Trichomonascus vanleenenianus TaxID=2268995 RepID=UPI003EC954BE
MEDVLEQRFCSIVEVLSKKDVLALASTSFRLRQLFYRHCDLTLSVTFSNPTVLAVNSKSGSRFTIRVEPGNVARFMEDARNHDILKSFSSLVVVFENHRENPSHSVLVDQLVFQLIPLSCDLRRMHLYNYTNRYVDKVFLLFEYFPEVPKALTTITAPLILHKTFTSNIILQNLTQLEYYSTENLVYFASRKYDHYKNYSVKTLTIRSASLSSSLLAKVLSKFAVLEELVLDTSIIGQLNGSWFPSTLRRLELVYSLDNNTGHCELPHKHILVLGNIRELSIVSSTGKLTHDVSCPLLERLTLSVLSPQHYESVFNLIRECPKLRSFAATGVPIHWFANPLLDSSKAASLQSLQLEEIADEETALAKLARSLVGLQHLMLNLTGVAADKAMLIVYSFVKFCPVQSIIVRTKRGGIPPLVSHYASITMPQNGETYYGIDVDGLRKQIRRRIAES